MKTQLMGILNITPDSFSDGGMYIDQQSAIKHANHMLISGADIIDIGGESTRPNSKEIDANLEINRIKNVVQELSSRCTISVDTFRSETAKTCLELGAKIINDVSALRYSKEMAKIIANYQAEVVLMYSKNDAPHADTKEKEYNDVLLEIRDFLSKRIDYALNQGISSSKIIIDPGMGAFISPNPKYSWEVIGRFNELVEYFSEFRLLIGTSRKGFLGKNEVDLLSQLSAMIATSKGAKIIRTHNVEMASKFYKLLDSLTH